MKEKKKSSKKKEKGSFLGKSKKERSKISLINTLDSLPAHKKERKAERGAGKGECSRRGPPISAKSS